MLGEKIKLAVGLCERMLAKYQRPCIFWSGGKDSMVILHMLKFLIGRELPVVCWREPWMPKKQKFVNRMIQEWDLVAWDWAPSKMALCHGKNRIDVMNHYQINTAIGQDPQYLILARGTEPPVEGLPFLCGLETFISRPFGTFNFPWDCAFHGHKSVDEDPLSGKLPLAVDLMQNPNAADAIFPLREWSDEDVFEYHRLHEVPFDETRYDIENKAVLKNDKEDNPDYYRTCFKCCDPTSSKFVRCPKYDVEMNNVSHLVPWIEPAMPYCGLRDEP
jgi:hypothetical protein